MLTQFVSMADFNRRLRGLRWEPSMEVYQGLRGREVVLVQEVGDHLQVSDTEEERPVRVELKLISE